MTEPELIGHVSDFRLDRLFAAELSPQLAEQTLAHTEACARCQLRLHELIDRRIKFRGLPRPPLSAPVHAPWHVLYVAVVAAIAGIALSTNI